MQLCPNCDVANCLVAQIVMWPQVLRDATKAHGPKAIVFAAEKNGPLKATDFERPEFLAMGPIDRTTLESIIRQSYLDSKKHYVKK